LKVNSNPSLTLRVTIKSKAGPRQWREVFGDAMEPICTVKNVTLAYIHRFLHSRRRSSGIRFLDQHCTLMW